MGEGKWGGERYHRVGWKAGVKRVGQLGLRLRAHNSLPSLVSPRSPPRDQMVRHPISLNASLSCLHVRSARPHSYFHPPPSPVINPSLSLSLFHSSLRIERWFGAFKRLPGFFTSPQLHQAWPEFLSFTASHRSKKQKKLIILRWSSPSN